MSLSYTSRTEVQLHTVHPKTLECYFSSAPSVHHKQKQSPSLQCSAQSHILLTRWTDQQVFLLTLRNECCILISFSLKKLRSPLTTKTGVVKSLGMALNMYGTERARLLLHVKLNTSCGDAGIGTPLAVACNSPHKPEESTCLKSSCYKACSTFSLCSTIFFHVLFRKL